MSLFFFDTLEDDASITDKTGVELQDRFAAAKLAIAKLRRLGKAGPPRRDLRVVFAVHVRDELGEPLLKTASSFAFEWLSHPGEVAI